MTPAVAPVHAARPDPASWRKSIGRRLREAREAAGLRLVDVARAARVSPQYLSEIERGRKEASSEVLAAVTGALGMTLVDLAGGVARELARTAGYPATLHLSSTGATSPDGVAHVRVAGASVRGASAGAFDVVTLVAA